jgi:hypothetical protein
VGFDLQQYTRDRADQRAIARIEEDVEGGERSGPFGSGKLTEGWTDFALKGENLH